MLTGSVQYLFGEIDLRLATLYNDHKLAFFQMLLIAGCSA